MDGDERTPVSSFWIDILRLALFLLPLAYVANIFAVAIHELLGHGVTALLLGGEFRSFVLKWDGMGWAAAWAGPNAPLSREILVRAGGIISTTLGGMVLLATSLLVRRRQHLELALLVFALLQLLEGPPYAFWNALYPSPPGDVSVMLTLLADSGAEATSRHLRWLMMCLGCLVSLAALLGGSLLLFRAVEEILGRGRSLNGYRRMVVLIVFILLPGAAGWLMFDWNQLAAGIGRLPAVTGTLVSTLVALLMYWKSLAPRSGTDAVRTTNVQIGVAWAACVATVVATTMVFSKGVTF